MPDHNSITPANIADQLDITIITLRRWCTAYAAHLSPLANPAPGQARRFTYRDREVLKHVKTLRDQGRSLGDIADLLADLSFPEIDASQEDTTLTIVEAPDTRQGTPANIVTLDAIMDIQRQVDALKQSVSESKHGQRDYVQGLAVGFVAALLFVLVIVGIAVLYGGFR